MTDKSPKDLFLDALDLEGEERARFLDAECAGDAALRRAVDELLAADGAAGRFMAAPTTALPLEAAAADGELDVGSTIGPYTLDAVLGEGGFGTVYRASQSEPVRREVAIKVLKAGMDSEQILQRFHLERQALALMTHPGVARILEIGSLETRRPYFVMEYVDGPPLTQYCDEHQIGVSGRLSLFEQVCLAVRHAHQRGIIHRDLKPTNILVTEADGKPVAKVIDFGIAKAATPTDDDPALTIEHQLIGTPQYMSPEQASGRNHELDTRTDVYSLGVVLYELLTGVTPLDVEALREAGPAGVHELLQHQEPPTPSTRMRTIASRDARHVEEVAQNRGTNPLALRRHLKGDLDAIVMKALERDREARYAGADAFAQDVRRFLDYQPVLAVSPGPVARALKFARRHWLALGAVVALVAGLGAGLVGTYIGREEARGEAARAIAVNEFMKEILGRAEPSELGGDVTLLDAIRLAAASIPDRFEAYPDQEVLARRMVGEVLASQTMHREAIEALRRGYALAQERYGDDDRQTLEIGFLLLDALCQGGKIDEIEGVGIPLVERYEAALGGWHEKTLEVRRLVAFAYIRRGNWPEAARRSREVLEVARAALGDDHPVVGRTAGDLAMALKAIGTRESLTEAVALLEESIGHRESFDGDDVSVTQLDAIHMLAYVRLTLGQLAPAVAGFRRMLELADGVLSEDHGLMNEAQLNLGTALHKMSEYEEAGEMAVAAIRGVRSRAGDRHPATLTLMTKALPVIVNAGQPEEGVQYTSVLYGFFGRSGHSPYAIEYGIWHARFLLRNDMLEDAEELLDEFADPVAEGDSDVVRSSLHLARGELALRRGDAVTADEELQTALRYARQSNEETTLLDETDILLALLEAAAARGAPEEEVEILRAQLAAAEARRRGDAPVD